MKRIRNKLTSTVFQIAQRMLFLAIIVLFFFHIFGLDFTLFGRVGAALGTRALSFFMLKAGFSGGIAFAIGFVVRALLTTEASAGPYHANGILFYMDLNSAPPLPAAAGLDLNSAPPLPAAAGLDLNYLPAAPQPGEDLRAAQEEALRAAREAFTARQSDTLRALDDALRAVEDALRAPQSGEACRAAEDALRAVEDALQADYVREQQQADAASRCSEVLYKKYLFYEEKARFLEQQNAWLREQIGVPSDVQLNRQSHDRA